MKRGFTLAEALMTLTIIGIVAVISLPGLITRHQEMETIAKLKKAYITLSDAFEMGVSVNGSPLEWDLGDVSSYATQADFEGSKKMYNAFGVYVRKSKDCEGKTGCFAEKYTYIDGREWADNLNSQPHRYKIITHDGMSMAFHAYSHDCSANPSHSDSERVCGLIMVDVNGPKKGKNMMGDDLFWFQLTEDGVFPYGEATDKCLQEHCIKTGSHCAKWVIENQNKDYFKCNDLSWYDKTKCNK